MNATPATPFPDSDAFRHRLQICADRVGNISKLAKASGLAQNTIRHYFEKGEPNRHNLLAIARAAQVSVEWLASGAGTPPSDSETSSENREAEQAFQKRFDQVLTRNGGITGLAGVAKLHPDRLAHVKAGGELNRRELEALSRHAGISTEWLITGNGQPQPQDEAPPPQDSPDAPKVIDRQTLLTLLEESQPPSDTWTPDPVDRLALAQRILAQLDPGPLIAHVMDNDTMMPKLDKGALLCFSPTTYFGSPGIYLFRHGSGRLMVARAIRSDRKVVCQVENPSYAGIGTMEFMLGAPAAPRCLGRLVAHLVAD